MPDPYANEYGMRDGIFSIHISSEYDRATDIHLVFPLKYKELTNATLEIKALQTSRGEKRVPPTLLKNGRKLLFCYTVLND